MKKTYQIQTLIHVNKIALVIWYFPNTFSKKYMLLAASISWGGSCKSPFPQPLLITDYPPHDSPKSFSLVSHLGSCSNLGQWLILHVYPKPHFPTNTWHSLVLISIKCGVFFLHTYLCISCALVFTPLQESPRRWSQNFNSWHLSFCRAGTDTSCFAPGMSSSVRPVDTAWWRIK